MFSKQYLFRMIVTRLIRVYTLQMLLNRLKVHYGAKNDSDPECDGEIIILVPRKSDIQSEELTWCCCERCHSKSCLCFRLSTCLCNEFPQHNTVNQFFTPRMFEAYHREGRRACEEAKANEFLKLFALPMTLETVWKNQRDLRSSLRVAQAVLRITKFHYTSTPTRHALQPLGGAGSSKDNEIPYIIRD